MTHQFSFSYMGCQTCQARVNCEECEKRLSRMLMRLEGVDGAAVQMGKKQLAIDGTQDRDALEEILEDLGIFIA